MTCSRMRWRGLICVGLLASAVALMQPAAAQPMQYALDPVHTRVMFAISHAGYSHAIGTVSGSTGSLVFDQRDWSTARLEACIPITRLDLGDEKWNRAALAARLLDSETFPTATFISTRIEPIDATHASVYGTLTLRGIANEVKLDVTLNQVKRYPLPPFRRTAGFSATASISRKAFGITAWPSVIGDSVELRIEAEASRSNGNRSDAHHRDDASEIAPEASAPESLSPEPLPPELPASESLPSQPLPSQPPAPESEVPEQPERTDPPDAQQDAPP